MKKSKDKKRPRKNAAEVLFWCFIINLVLAVVWVVAVILIAIYKNTLFAQKEIELLLEIIGIVLVSAATIIMPLSIIIAEIVEFFRGRKKKREEELRKKNKKPSSVKKIFKTTDGYFNNRPDIKKPRNVAVIEQRKEDGAVAVVKIFSKEGKEDKIGATFIPDLTLMSKDHKALTEDSIVGRHVIMGIKQKDNSYIPIYSSDLQKTEDELTEAELIKIQEEVHNDESKHRATYERKLKNWKNRSFKK